MVERKKTGLAKARKRVSILQQTPLAFLLAYSPSSIHGSSDSFLYYIRVLAFTYNIINLLSINSRAEIGKRLVGR